LIWFVLKVFPASLKRANHHPALDFFEMPVGQKERRFCFMVNTIEVNASDWLNQQEQEAQSKASGGFGFFFRLSDKRRTVIRPLLNLGSCPVLHFHHFFDATEKKFVDAVCGGKECLYCHDQKLTENERTKKDLEAKQRLLLPVWTYGIQAKKVDKDSKMEILDDNNNPIWERVTYTDKDANQEKDVSGFCVMQLALVKSAFADMTSKFKKIYDAGESITIRDFVIERQGGDQTTKYILSKKDPSPFKVQIDPVTPDSFRAMLLEKAAPVTLDSATLQGGEKESGKTDGSIFNF
jgi:hypothetical protein